MRHSNSIFMTENLTLVLRAADNQIKSLAQDNIVDINLTEGAAASSGDESEGWSN